MFNKALMLRLATKFGWRTNHALSRSSLKSPNHLFSENTISPHERHQQQPLWFLRCISSSTSAPSLSIWRRNKGIGKEGLIVAKELKRLRSDPLRLDHYIRSNVSRLLKPDIVAVLFEFQRQNQVFLCMKLYDVVRKEIWYRPDVFFYRDMLMMLARNKQADEVKRVWRDVKSEGVLFDQYTFGDLVRAFLDNGMPSRAMQIYDEMRQSPDRPSFLPFRVMLKGLLPYPELREKVKDDFFKIFPHMTEYDLSEDEE